MSEQQPTLKLGMIGTDTSHVPAFARVLNDPSHAGHVSGAKVVAACNVSSPDLPASRDRADEYAAQVRDQLSVEIVTDIRQLCEKVDGILLMSVDGRRHVDEARVAFSTGKPVYIDKPLAHNLAAAREIAHLGAEQGVPWFSCSSLRFWDEVTRIRNAEIGSINACDAWSPCHLDSTHDLLFWYGIHGVETLYTFMGIGCDTVVGMHDEGVSVAVGRWDDGRVGTFRGIRQGRADYGATVFGSQAIMTTTPMQGDLYRPLVQQIVTFMHTHEPPVHARETMEIMAFMHAFQVSVQREGAPVSIDTVLRESFE